MEEQQDVIINENTENGNNEIKKQVSFEVNMNSRILYDYLINHAYSGASGIIGSCFGTLGIIVFIRYGSQALIYLILGILLILYLPVSLRLKASQMMNLVESFKKPLGYVLDEKGITVSQGDETQSIEWDKCTKAVSTKVSIVLYTGKNNASIFPRKQLEDKLPALISVIAENMEPSKVKIKF